MCMTDDFDGRSTQLRSEDVAARKPHHCCECSRLIAVGETHHIYVYLFEGDFFSDRTCSHCYTASQWLVRECRGFILTRVEEDLREHWQEVGIRTRELAVLIWGIGRQWRKRDGSLMPLPTISATPATA